MSDPSAIVVPADAVEVVVGSAPGQRISDWPATGTYLSIAKGSPLGTVTEGLNTVTFSKNGSKFYNVGMTVTQHHKDDIFLSAAILAQQNTKLLQALGIAYQGRVYASIMAYILEEPTRELAADGTAHVTYMFGAWFDQIIIAKFQQPGTLSPDVINSYLQA
jgi:hypothetical protein